MAPHTSIQHTPASSKRRTAGLWALSFVLGCSVSAPGWAVNQPTIHLLPTTVIENLKQTATEAKAMEDSLQQVIGTLDAQRKLYQASHCEGAVGDAGCEQIQRQIAESYGQLLTSIETALPNIERNVQNTFTSVSQRLRTEVGYKMTPLGIERMLSTQPGSSRASGGQTGAAASNPPDKHQRLSRLFGNLASLVSQQGRGDPVAVMASGIYWDTRQVLSDIQNIKQDIAIARVQLDVFSAYGQITPEMLGTVNSVKSLLFGEVQDVPVPAALSEPEPVFVSDYERR